MIRGLARWAGRIKGEFDAAKWKRLGLTDAAAWAAFAGRESAAGKLVNLDRALQLATVWACIRLTAEAIAGLPLQFYSKGDDGSREEWDDDQTIDVLTIQPNRDQSAYHFWQAMAGWAAAQGNSYAEKTYVGTRLMALHHFPNTQCSPARDENNNLVYRIVDRGKNYTLPREKIFHLRGFGLGGDLALSPIACGVQTIGTAMAADEAAGKMFANGLQASGLLKVDAKLSDEQREQIEKVMEKFIGSERWGKLMVLGAGMSFDSLQLNPNDAQMVETRRFEIEEICRWWNVPPIFVGHAAQGQTMWGTGVEQLLIAWLTLGLNPWLRSFEAQIRIDLIPRNVRHRTYGEFNREGLLQADSETKAKFLGAMVQNALMTRNEARKKINLPRVDGGDELTAQTNLAPLDQLGQSDVAGNQLRNSLRGFLGIEDPEK